LVSQIDKKIQNLYREEFWKQKVQISPNQPSSIASNQELVY
jgi:hypothetical protein